MEFFHSEDVVSTTITRERTFSISGAVLVFPDGVFVFEDESLVASTTEDDSCATHVDESPGLSHGIIASSNRSDFDSKKNSEGKVTVALVRRKLFAMGTRSLRLCHAARLARRSPQVRLD